MKKVTFLTMVLVACCVILNAQSDTIAQSTNGYDHRQLKDYESTELDSSELHIFEGSFNEDSESDVNLDFNFRKFIFIPNNKSKKEIQKRMYGHDGGFSIGLNQMSDKGLSQIGNVENAGLQYTSYELALQLGSINFRISHKAGLLFFTGVGLRFVQYNADKNTAFQLVDFNTVQCPAPEGISYKISKMNNWYVTIPLMFEWQLKSNHRSLYLQAGVETGIRLSSVSKVKYFIDGEKYKDKLAKGLNMNPITLDAKVGIGYKNFGVYARYGLLDLFRKGRGPEVVPLALGLVFDL